MDLIGDIARAVDGLLSLTERPFKPAIEKPVTGLNIWLYVSPEKESRRERINKEIDKRGLSIGELRFEHSTFGIKLRFPSRTKYPEVLAALEKALTDSEETCLTKTFGVQKQTYRLSVPKDQDAKKIFVVNQGHAAMVTVPEDGGFPFHCVHTSGLCDGEPFSHKVFMRIDGFIESSASIECYSPEAVEIALLTARRLDLEYDEPHFAHESAIPLHQIVTEAYRWKDKHTNKFYVQVTYREKRVRHQSTRGQHVRYAAKDAQSGTKTVVLASRYDFPSLTLNNMVVGTWRIFRPTRQMTEARGTFRRRERRICSVSNCSEMAAKEVTVNRSMIEDMAGSWAHGSVYHVCTNPEHAKIIMNDNPKCAWEVRTYRPEIW